MWCLFVANKRRRRRCRLSKPPARSIDALIFVVFAVRWYGFTFHTQKHTTRLRDRRQRERESFVIDNVARGAAAECTIEMRAHTHTHTSNRLSASIGAFFLFILYTGLFVVRRRRPPNDILIICAQHTQRTGGNISVIGGGNTPEINFFLEAKAVSPLHVIYTCVIYSVSEFYGRAQKFGDNSTVLWLCAT